MLNILIPMAGLGSRFTAGRYDKPKPLIDVNGKPMIQVAVETLGLEGNFIYVVQKSHRMTELLTKITPGCKVVEIDELTDGAAATALLAKEFINSSDPLIITNCDQAMDWNPEDFLAFVESVDQDGSIVTYKSDDLKNSFAKVEDGWVTQVVEKKPLSDIALIGVHYWAEGSLFVDSAEWLMNNFKTLGYKEAYVSTTYQYLIDNGAKISSYMLEPGGYIPLGTPADLDLYLGKDHNEDHKD